MRPLQPNHGILCALWTPLNGNGDVDLDLLDRHLDWLTTTGLNGLMVLGSTGRFLYLTPEQRETVLRHVIRRTLGVLPVLANVSDLDGGVVASLGRVARESGAAAVSLLPRWYFEEARSDLEEWFVAGAEASGLPLWLYNFPERTGNRIDLNTIRAVCDRVAVGGFKHSGAHQDFLRELAPLARSKGFSLFAGADARIPESLELGAAGCIGGLANAVPDLMVAVYRAAAAGNPGGASAQLEMLRMISQRMHLVPFPLNIAAVMEARGVAAGRLPSNLSRVTLAHYSQLKKEAEALLRGAGVGSPG